MKQAQEIYKNNETYKICVAFTTTTKRTLTAKTKYY